MLSFIFLDSKKDEHTHAQNAKLAQHKVTLTTHFVALKRPNQPKDFMITNNIAEPCGGLSTVAYCAPNFKQNYHLKRKKNTSKPPLTTSISPFHHHFSPPACSIVPQHCRLASGCERGGGGGSPFFVDIIISQGGYGHDWG